MIPARGPETGVFGVLAVFYSSCFGETAGDNGPPPLPAAKVKFLMFFSLGANWGPMGANGPPPLPVGLGWIMVTTLLTSKNPSRQIRFRE